MKTQTMIEFQGGGASENIAVQRFAKFLEKTRFLDYTKSFFYFLESFPQFKNYKTKFNTAFTLSEVLITLGVIGIVAAMTLPTVINRANEKQCKVAYKKAYSTIQQAFLRAFENGELVDMTPQDVLPGGAPYTPAVGENFKTLSKYIKTSKTCFDRNADECWECENGQAGYHMNGGPNWLGCRKSSYAFIDTSGVAWYLYKNIEYLILVDVNGFKNPNKLGKDRFVMLFGANNDNSKEYASNPTQILPYRDIIAKQRWCPDGNCLYQSWILK